MNTPQPQAGASTHPLLPVTSNNDKDSKIGATFLNGKAFSKNSDLSRWGGKFHPHLPYGTEGSYIWAWFGPQIQCLVIPAHHSEGHLKSYLCTAVLKQTAHKECNFQTFTTDASSSFPVVLYMKSSICPSFPFTPLEQLLPRSLTSFFLKISRSFLYPHSLWLFSCVDHIFFDTLFTLGFCDLSCPDSSSTS